MYCSVLFVPVKRVINELHESAFGLGSHSWPVPSNIHQSRAFVSLCQYCWRFVPRFSDVATPLHALTKKGSRYLWTDEYQNGFDTLKTMLVGANALTLSTEDGCYILDGDASDT